MDSTHHNKHADRQHKQRRYGWLAVLIGAVLGGIWLWRARRQHRAAVSLDDLADHDSRFLEIDGLRIHYKQAGQGEPVLVLVHGSFLSLFSWRNVYEPLAEHSTVLAFDRPAFGLSTPTDTLHAQANPYTPEAQADLIIALLDRLHIQQAILVGNSTGGTISMLAALRHPQRVKGLVLIGAMVYSGYATSEIPRWLLPSMRAAHLPGSLLLRVLMSRIYERALRVFWWDQVKLTPAIVERYQEMFLVEHWERALWKLMLSSHNLHLEARLPDLHLPVLVMTGRHDRAVPAEQSRRLAEALPNARLVVLEECGHLPQEEQSVLFLQAIREWLAQHSEFQSSSE